MSEKYAAYQALQAAQANLGMNEDAIAEKDPVIVDELMQLFESF